LPFEAAAMDFAAREPAAGVLAAGAVDCPLGAAIPGGDWAIAVMANSVDAVRHAKIVFLRITAPA